MDVLVLASAAVVSAVVAVAAAGKLRDPDGLVGALPGLGISDRHGRLIGRSLPVVELALGAALWVPVTRRWAGAGATLLLLVFLGLVSAAVVRGRRVRCACFGSLSAADLSWTSVLRNAVLVGLAAIVAARPATWGAAARSVDGGGVVLALGGVVGALAVSTALLARLQLDLLRRYGEVLNRLDSGAAPGTTTLREPDSLIEVGAVAPGVTVGELDRGPVALPSLWGAGRALLLFVSPSCGACRSIMGRVAEFASRHQDVAVAVISPHSPRKTRDSHPGAPIRWLVDRTQAAFEAFGVTRTPIAVLVDEHGEVVETARGSAQVVALLDEVAVTTLSLDDIELFDEAGNPAALRDVVGPEGALLFWNPDCGWCQELQPQLPTHDGAVVGSTVAIVAGPIRADAGPGNGWPVLFDPGRTAARVAESPGTPSLIRLAGGQPLGPAAAGGPAVLEALGVTVDG
ncbi:MAG TPA: MauE/DoxX family redox-associated membrane protein [Acidimicrobiales bacterium]|jgi:thiol-disulfide isomerase/thioredoxin|nr:MauE/DoxX family redox-associated membrane protein [Acidimicrobiales bacterium]